MSINYKNCQPYYTVGMRNSGAKSCKNIAGNWQSLAHSGGTETKVKEIVSDIPPHTNQNIGIF